MFHHYEYGIRVVSIEMVAKKLLGSNNYHELVTNGINYAVKQVLEKGGQSGKSLDSMLEVLDKRIKAI